MLTLDTIVHTRQHPKGMCETDWMTHFQNTGFVTEIGLPTLRNENTGTVHSAASCLEYLFFFSQSLLKSQFLNRFFFTGVVE